MRSAAYLLANTVLVCIIVVACAITLGQRAALRFEAVPALAEVDGAVPAMWVPALRSAEGGQRGAAAHLWKVSWTECLCARRKMPDCSLLRAA